MSFDRKPVRYAHSAGHTDVCYSEDGLKLITCGTDGDIRIWSGFDDYDPVQTCVGEWSLCVRQKRNQILIGTDSNNVQLLTYPNGERDSILIRFTAHVNHMVIGKDHNFIALAAEDMEIKLIDLSEPKGNALPLSFTGLKGPPLSVAMCPKAELLCVTSGDGYLRIWNAKTQNLLKEINCVPKVNSFMNAKLLCRIDFEPILGKYLAYPDENSVMILNAENWEMHKKLSVDSVTASFSIVQFSPCANFIAAASELGDVVIWEVSSQVVVNSSMHQSPMAICAMVWNPLGNGEVAYCDVQGQLGILTDCIKSPQIEIEQKTNEEGEVDFGGVQFEDDDDDEDGENVVSLEKLKNSIMGPEPELEFDKQSSASSSRPRTPEVPLQAAFMPSSTPEHLNPRYLCWNDIGIVRSYGSPEEESQSIEVEFHDSTFHNSMMMQNFHNYNMASLSATALGVAHSEKITVIPLNASAKEWSLNVEENVEITCVAVSNKLACFSTAKYFVHICTVYGTQKAVISTPGPVVSMAANQDVLLIAYHSASPRKDDQCISMMLIRCQGMSILNKSIPCALSQESNLFWIGFTDVGTPALLDSSGILSLFPLASNLWLPFCNTAKQKRGVSDGFFVTAVFESCQMVRGIYCKGSNYPGFTPRPTLTEIPLEPPFVEMDTGKSQMEANLYTWKVLQVDDVDKKFVETGLKSFVLACKNNLDQRALELLELLENQQILSLALKYATKLDKWRLAEKIDNLIPKTDDCENRNQEILKPVSTPIIHIQKQFMLEKPVSTPIIHIQKPPMLDYKSKCKSKRKFKSKSKPSETPSTSTTTTEEESVLNKSAADTTVNTQESLFSTDEPKNPFLKSLKQNEPSTSNPLSLLDKYAGFDVDKKEKKTSKDVKEKRKQPDSSGDAAEMGEKQKEKQRKLDQFMFSKQK